VIAGNGHLSYYQGVPERVLAENPDLIDQCCLVTSHEWEGGLIGGSTIERLMDDLEAGPPGANPADYLYVFQEGEDPDAVKEETKEAYNRVGETAHLEGNAKRARAIMGYLGYTEEQIDVAGGDAFNYQGVGNPFLNANIKPGDRVMDVGSGLGIDSLIAAHHAGPDGKVIGIDISQREVDHAQARADARGLDIRFQVADMEEIPLPDNCLDVIISNGAFCLAPNKEKAFAELYRVLKPGGRIAVCTTTIQSEKLDKGVEWPICMRMFVSKDDLEPLCKRLGFVDVVIDDSDSKMTYELPEELLELNPERNRVHIGGEEFEHLDAYDMDDLCARVCVVARKPPFDGQQQQQQQQQSNPDKAAESARASEAEVNS
jgi:SAM-dependent methyltransferase